MRDRKVPLAGLETTAARLADDGKTPMYVAVDGRAAGIVPVADTVKEDSGGSTSFPARWGCLEEN
jgi:Cu+-exporting ATPase